MLKTHKLHVVENIEIFHENTVVSKQKRDIISVMRK